MQIPAKNLAVAVSLTGASLVCPPSTVSTIRPADFSIVTHEVIPTAHSITILTENRFSEGLYAPAAFAKTLRMKKAR